MMSGGVVCQDGQETRRSSTGNLLNTFECLECPPRFKLLLIMCSLTGELVHRFTPAVGRNVHCLPGEVHRSSAWTHPAYGITCSTMCVRRMLRV